MYVVLLLLDIFVWALIHTLKLIVIMFSTHHYIVKNANFIQLNDNIPITIDNNELKDNNVINSKCILSYDRLAYLIINISGNLHQLTLDLIHQSNQLKVLIDHLPKSDFDYDQNNNINLNGINEEYLKSVEYAS